MKQQSYRGREWRRKQEQKHKKDQKFSKDKSAHNRNKYKHDTEYVENEKDISGIPEEEI